MTHRARFSHPATESMTGRSGQRRASGPGPATSLDFTLLGTSPKKAKVQCSCLQALRWGVEGGGVLLRSLHALHPGLGGTCTLCAT